MVGHGGSSAGSYLADPTSPIPSHCASIVATSKSGSHRQGSVCASCVPINQTYYRCTNALNYDLWTKSNSIIIIIIVHLYWKAPKPSQRCSKALCRSHDIQENNMTHTSIVLGVPRESCLIGLLTAAASSAQYDNIPSHIIHASPLQSKKNVPQLHWLIAYM